MSAQLEIEPPEMYNMHPDAQFGTLLQEVQKEGYPAYLGWAMKLTENKFGYVVQAPGTRRVVTIIEQLHDDGNKWLAQTFRVRDDDGPATFEMVCRQMTEETGAFETSQPEVSQLLQTLYLGYGMTLQYPSVILECNNPSPILASSDFDRMTFSPSTAQELPFESNINIGETVRQTLEHDTSEAAALTIDVGLHMGNASQEIFTGEDVITVYRSRFQTYPWASGEEGPLFQDLVLVKVNDGSIWYTGAIEFDKEVTRYNVDSFRTYGNQLIDADVPYAVVEGIMARVINAGTNSAPSYLMTDQLRRQTEHETEFEQDASNPYDFLDDLENS